MGGMLRWAIQEAVYRNDLKKVYKHKTDGGAEYLSTKPEGPEFLSGVFARVDGGFELIGDNLVSADDVWTVIHKIENECRKNSMIEMSATQLRTLLSDVYDMLGAIVM